MGINANLLMEDMNWFKNLLIQNLKVNFVNSFLKKITVIMDLDANLLMNKEIFNKYN